MNYKINTKEELENFVVIFFAFAMDEVSWFQRVFEFNSPEFFDKSLFQSFIKELTKLEYLRIDEDENIHFVNAMINMADNARLVLNEDTLNTLQQITNFSSSEVQTIMVRLKKQKSYRKYKKK